MSRRGVLESEARMLVESGAVRSVSIEPAPGDGWAVVLRVGMDERPIRSKREDVRTWASLDTLIGWLRRLGVADAAIRVQG
ncbi:hypothetical protein P8631_11875 [Guyparkeria sp. 1SP6A2]|nr:hypothetical protein [Guyparkeria sp. 1SP6A2]